MYMQHDRMVVQCSINVIESYNSASYRTFHWSNICCKQWIHLNHKFLPYWWLVHTDIWTERIPRMRSPDFNMKPGFNHVVHSQCSRISIFYLTMMYKHCHGLEVFKFSHLKKWGYDFHEWNVWHNRYTPEFVYSSVFVLFNLFWLI